jgi:phage tail sheath protein FI
MTYLAPGVYVQEVPSSAAPIAGVSTSTAGFVGIVPDRLDLTAIVDEPVGVSDGTTTTYTLRNYPVDIATGLEVMVAGTAAPATAQNDDADGVSKVTLATAPAAGQKITASYLPQFQVVGADTPQLCTTWGDFVKSFGDFTTDPNSALEHRWLAHAVYGFFNNGGSRCYVARVGPPAGAAAPNFDHTLTAFEAIDEIAMVAAPGLSGQGSSAADIQSAIVTHCAIRTGDRFAIFDGPRDLTNDDLTQLAPGGAAMPADSDYAAVYFPWIQVSDPGLGQRTYIPPSGHIAGLYARVDNTRGVHKAPANEVVEGALGLRYNVSRAQQEGLNPQGVNIIRNLNGNIRVWGARTIGGDANTEWRYISIRRLFLFLRKSIEEGTQWTVFEPNSSALWAKIVRNITAFLTGVWRDGALFGATPAEAFYVKCDQDTNPPDVRDAGRVVTEIGVAVVKPAEFVIFRISQWAGPGG